MQPLLWISAIQVSYWGRQMYPPRAHGRSMCDKTIKTTLYIRFLNLFLCSIRDWFDPQFTQILTNNVSFKTHSCPGNWSAQAVLRVVPAPLRGLWDPGRGPLFQHQIYVKPDFLHKFQQITTDWNQKQRKITSPLTHNMTGICKNEKKRPIL